MALPQQPTSIGHMVKTVIGGALVLALSGISITCCFVFGQHLAPGNEGMLYGVLGAVADAFKALLPLLIVAALAARHRIRAVAGIAMFAVISLYSFSSELGLYALSRDAVSSNAGADKEAWNSLKVERERVQKRLTSLGEAIRLPAAVIADIAGQKQGNAWTSSKGCTDATAATSRTFCANVERLKGELAVAEEASQLRVQDTNLGAKLAGVNLASAMRSADAQSESLARFTGLAPATIRDALALIVAVLIELCSGLGLYVATAPASSPKPEPEPKAKAERKTKAKAKAKQPKTAAQRQKEYRARQKAEPARLTVVK